MQQLQPEIKKLQEKYKNNAEGRTKAQQELFRKHNYNPLSGCLPIFIQVPVMVGLYRALMVAIELRDAPLFSPIPFAGARTWPRPTCSTIGAGSCRRLSSEGTNGIFSLGPYFNLLPILTVVLFIWQQKVIMPPPADEQAAMQQKIMQYMMVFMGLMFYKVGSGLCIYFIVQSLWGLVERRFLPKTPPPAANSPGNGSQDFVALPGDVETRARPRPAQGRRYMLRRPKRRRGGGSPAGRGLSQFSCQRKWDCPPFPCNWHSRRCTLWTIRLPRLLRRRVGQPGESCELAGPNRSLASTNSSKPATGSRFRQPALLGPWPANFACRNSSRRSLRRVSLGEHLVVQAFRLFRGRRDACTTSAKLHRSTRGRDPYHRLAPASATRVAIACAPRARPAEPGEFTLRAFLAGRIDLCQAEAVLGVIDAADPQDLTVALSQLAGGLSHPLQRLRDALVDLLAQVEAGFDFADEDLAFVSREELDRQLADADSQRGGDPCPDDRPQPNRPTWCGPCWWGGRTPARAASSTPWPASMPRSCRSIPARPAIIWWPTLTSTA